jgi:hypothetical protein
MGCTGPPSLVANYADARTWDFLTAVSSAGRLPGPDHKVSKLVDNSRSWHVSLTSARQDTPSAAAKSRARRPRLV